MTSIIRNEGIDLQSYQWVLPRVVRAIERGVENYHYMLSDGQRLKLYDARKETPVLSILDNSKPQFTWSFAIGNAVERSDRALWMVKRRKFSPFSDVISNGNCAKQTSAP
jgi:hypothetical protein